MSSSLHNNGRPKRSQPSKPRQGKAAKGKPAGRSRGKTRAALADRSMWRQAGRLTLIGSAVMGALAVGLLLGGSLLKGKGEAARLPESAIEAHAPAHRDPPLAVTARRTESLIAALPYEENQPPAQADHAETNDPEVAEVMAAMQPDSKPQAVADSANSNSAMAKLAVPDAPTPADRNAAPLVPDHIPAIPAPMVKDKAGTPQWLAYAVPMPEGPTDKPVIAIVIDDMGIDQPRSRKALALPGPLTLAFLPYGYHLAELSAAARANGHELLVHMPMQPSNPSVDPGPQALLVGLTPDQIRERLRWGLAQLSGYVGFNNHMGSRFTAWGEGMDVVLDEAASRGLLFLDSVTATDSKGGSIAAAKHLPFAVRDVFLDNDASPAAVAKQLARTEEIARKRGHAIAIGHPHDGTIQALSAWLPTIRAKGFRLGTVSAIVRMARNPPSGQG